MTAWPTRSQGPEHPAGPRPLPAASLPDYFGNCARLVYLAQTKDKARQVTERLGLAFEYRFTGYYGELAGFMEKAAGE